MGGHGQGFVLKKGLGLVCAEEMGTGSRGVRRGVMF